MQYNAGQEISYRVLEAGYEIQLPCVKQIPHTAATKTHSGYYYYYYYRYMKFNYLC